MNHDVQNFEVAVIERSYTIPVLVDFLVYKLVRLINIYGYQAENLYYTTAIGISTYCNLLQHKQVAVVGFCRRELDAKTVGLFLHVTAINQGIHVNCGISSDEVSQFRFSG